MISASEEIINNLTEDLKKLGIKLEGLEEISKN